MLTVAAWLRDLLFPILTVGFVVLAVLWLVLIVQRLMRTAFEAASQSIAQRYEPLIDVALSDRPDADVMRRLRAVPRRHRRIVARLLLAPLPLVTGAILQRAHCVAVEIGLLSQWHEDLHARGWWARAEAALALGLVKDEQAIARLVEALDDDHEQVRAAAVDSLGRIGRPEVAPILLARLSEESRYERARMVEALRAIGTAATQPLLEHAARHPAQRAVAADILGYVAGSQALASLLEWTGDDDPATRAASWRALAAIGVDSRAYYHALRALDDRSPSVRAAASLALGRAGRSDAAAYLAGRLDDEWEVAAQAARALARIGPAGLASLRMRMQGPEGLGRQLAHQLAWEGSAGDTPLRG